MTAAEQTYLAKIKTQLDEARLALTTQLQQSDSQYDLAAYQMLVNTPVGEWVERLTLQVGPEYWGVINKIERLEAAQSQIEISQFGYCCDCETTIESDLLKSDITTQRCKQCADQVNEKAPVHK